MATGATAERVHAEATEAEGVMNETCQCGERAAVIDRDGAYCQTHWDEMEKARNAKHRRLTKEAGGPWPQTCPRRMSDFGPWERDENLDLWEIRDQLHKGLVARHCSFCGSLHPDDFMTLLIEGWQLGTTDKNYKAYLGAPEGRTETKFYYQHLSEDQRKQFVELYNQRKITFQGGFGFSRLPFFMRAAADG